VLSSAEYHADSTSKRARRRSNATPRSFHGSRDRSVTLRPSTALRMTMRVTHWESFWLCLCPQLTGCAPTKRTRLLPSKANRGTEKSWGASMVSTAGVIHQAAPGSIPGRSSRAAHHCCEVVDTVLSSVCITPAGTSKRARRCSNAAPRYCKARRHANYANTLRHVDSSLPITRPPR
jgi:hypothetical protein